MSVLVESAAFVSDNIRENFGLLPHTEGDSHGSERDGIEGHFPLYQNIKGRYLLRSANPVCFLKECSRGDIFQFLFTLFVVFIYIYSRSFFPMEICDESLASP